MPAPKNPNTAAASEAAAVAATARRIETAAAELRAAGWTIAAPDAEGTRVARAVAAYQQACRKSNRTLGRGDDTEIHDLVDVRDRAWQVIELLSRNSGADVADPAMAARVARVRALLAGWEGPDGWTEVEGNKDWDAGYKTAWRERTEELRAALQGGAKVRCPNCGSDRLSWGHAFANPTNAAVFYLGCDDCSETIKTIRTDDVCAILDGIR